MERNAAIRFLRWRSTALVDRFWRKEVGADSLGFCKDGTVAAEVQLGFLDGVLCLAQ